MAQRNEKAEIIRRILARNPTQMSPPEDFERLAGRASQDIAQMEMEPEPNAELEEAVRRYKQVNMPLSKEHWLKGAIRGLVLPGGGYEEEFQRNRQTQSDALQRVQAMKQMQMQESAEKRANYGVGLEAAERSQRARQSTIDEELRRAQVTDLKADIERKADFYPLEIDKAKAQIRASGAPKIETAPYGSDVYKVTPDAIEVLRKGVPPPRDIDPNSPEGIRARVNADRQIQTVRDMIGRARDRFQSDLKREEIKLAKENKLTPSQASAIHFIQKGFDEDARILEQKATTRVTAADEDMEIIQKVLADWQMEMDKQLKVRTKEAQGVIGK